MKLKRSTIFVQPLMVLFLFIFSLALSSPLSAQELSANDLVSKCVEKLGGEKTIQAFSNFSGEGESKFSFGPRQFNGTLKMTQLGKKSYVKMKIKFGSNEFIVIQAYDGKIAWAERMGSVSDQPTLNSESDNDHTVALLIKKGVTFKLDKETEIDGKKVIGVIAEFDGKKTVFNIDKNDYTISEIYWKDTYFGDKGTKETLEKKIRYQNYQLKGDMLFPYTMTLFMKGKKVVEQHFSTLTFNPKVSEQLFQRPDEELDLRYFEELMD